jgi:hypothetical protein
MTRKTGQILYGLLGISGLIHISGLFTNWRYDFHAGVFLTIIGGLWLTIDFLKNGKTFLSADAVTIEKLDFKWYRIKELVITALLFLLLLNNEGELPESLLVTFILFSSFIVILDHRRRVEISSKEIIIDGMSIPFEGIRTIDFRQGEIILVTDESVGNPSGQIRIDLSDFSEKNGKLLVEHLKTC